MLTILGSPCCSASWTNRITPYDVSFDTPMWRTCSQKDLSLTSDL